MRCKFPHTTNWRIEDIYTNLLLPFSCIKDLGGLGSGILFKLYELATLGAAVPNFCRRGLNQLD